MIVVAGEPRSGTSLLMLIIKTLGLKICGEEFLSRGIGFNPTGIWEVFGIPNNGITKEILAGDVPRRITANSNLVTNEPIVGDVIKLTTKGLLKSDHALIDKLIYCIRDPREVIVSQRQQTGWESDKFQWDKYNVNMARLLDAVEPHEWGHIYIVDYGDMMWNPKEEVEKLAKYLGVEATEEAIAIPDPKHYRSKKHKAKRNKTAEKYYQYLRYRKEELWQHSTLSETSDTTESRIICS